MSCYNLKVFLFDKIIIAIIIPRIYWKLPEIVGLPHLDGPLLVGQQFVSLQVGPNH